jgi:hypothetical protein
MFIMSKNTVTGYAGKILRVDMTTARARAGGSGRGAVRALYHLEDYLRRLGFEILDLVSVTRFSKVYKLPMLKAAGQLLVAN